MDLPSPNNREGKPIIPEMNGPVPPEPQHRVPGAQILRLVTLVIVGLLVLLLLFLGGRWIYHTVHHTSKTTSTSGKSGSNSSQPSSSSQNSGTSSGSTSSNSSSAGSQSGSSSQSSTGSSANSQSSSTSNLSNTGPGNTAVVFTIAAATGIIGYQIVLRRRQL